MDSGSSRPEVGLRSFAMVLFAATILVDDTRVVSSGVRPQQTLADPTTINLGRRCLDVIDFGADPTGMNDSADAFQRVPQSATFQNGKAVFAPTANYKISHNLTPQIRHAETLLAEAYRARHHKAEAS